MKVLTAAEAQEKADELREYAEKLVKEGKAKPQDIKEAQDAAAQAQAEADKLKKQEEEKAAAEESSTGKKVVASKELVEARGLDVSKHGKLFQKAAKDIITDLVSRERGKDADAKAAKVNAGIKEVVIVSYAIDEKNKRASVVADCGNYGRRKAEVVYPVK